MIQLPPARIPFRCAAFFFIQTSVQQPEFSGWLLFVTIMKQSKDGSREISLAYSRSSPWVGTPSFSGLAWRNGASGEGAAVLARTTSSDGSRLDSIISPPSRRSISSAAAKPRLYLGGWTVVSG